MRIGVTIGMALSVLAAPAAARQEQPRTNQQAETMRAIGLPGLTGSRLAEAIAAADAHPLGSKENPVRSNMPQGERAYLDKLRCADGSAPAYVRLGNIGVGAFGYVVDHYQVTCEGQPGVSVMMDMYHDHEESRPVPGFTLAAAAPLPTS